MSSYVFPIPARPAIGVLGMGRRFPVRRIFCVGRNYAEHAREMGGDDRDPPFFFTKPADAIAGNGAAIPYPPRTEDLHHEIELVVAIGRGGADIPVDQAEEHVFGYAVGNDLPRRDLQSVLRKAGRPWDVAKGFDNAAPVTAITPAEKCGHLKRGRIWLSVNGSLRQEGDIADMIWNVPEIIAELSTLFTLCPGDLIFTGTPAGVGPLKPGDEVEGGVEGLETLRHRIG